MVNRWGNSGHGDRFYFFGLQKSLQMVTAVMKLKDACFLEEVQFSRSVVSDSLQPHRLQHARLPCPSPVPGACPTSCPLSRWCHPTISSSVAPFSFCPQSFAASGSFLTSSLHQVAKVNWSFSFSCSNEYSGLVSFGIDWFDVLAVQGTLKSLLQHHNLKASVLWR